jgi:abortive infection bacteriophage resistance protein
MSEFRPLKPYLTPRDQLTQLKTRGLLISDDALALQALARYGYYRLSGYYYPLRKTNPVGIPGRQDSFVDGASFDLVVQLADFDKRLRLLAWDAIESIEIAVRVAIAQRLGKIDPLAHLNPDKLDGGFSKPSNKWQRDNLTSPYQE